MTNIKNPAATVRTYYLLEQTKEGWVWSLMHYGKVIARSGTPQKHKQGAALEIERVKRYAAMAETDTVLK